MKITLLSDDAIRLEPTPGPMTIEAMTTEQSYSPFHMLASGLAYCTFSVMYAWATHADLDGDDLTIDVHWTFAEDPHRVGEISLTFDWPSLPEKRRAAAERVAAMCAIHATLTHPPHVVIRAGTATASADAPAAGGVPAAAGAAP